MLRLAVPSDAEQLAEVHTRSWQGGYEGILPQAFLESLNTARRERWWREALENGRRAHVVDTNGIVGFCHAEASEDVEDWGEVYSIYVLPEHWGEGHGHDLMQAGLTSLRVSGFEQALLWVFEDNDRARAFYEREGWVLGKPFRVEEIGGAHLTEVRYEIEL